MSLISGQWKRVWTGELSGAADLERTQKRPGEAGALLRVGQTINRVSSRESSLWMFSTSADKIRLYYIPALSLKFTKTGHGPPPSQRIWTINFSKMCNYFSHLDCASQVALLEPSFCCHNPAEAGEKYGKECHGWVVMSIYFQYIYKI